MAETERSRLLIPALAPLYERLWPLGWTIVRVACGGALIPHGWGKLVGGKLVATAAGFAKLGLEPAYPLALYIGCLELIGGTMLVLGLFTRAVAAQVVGFMAVAVVHVHWANGYFWTDKGYEYPLFWGLVALALVIRGGGPLSLDRRLPKEI